MTEIKRERASANFYSKKCTRAIAKRYYVRVTSSVRKLTIAPVVVADINSVIEWILCGDIFRASGDFGILLCRRVILFMTLYYVIPV